MWQLQDWFKDWIKSLTQVLSVFLPLPLSMSWLSFRLIPPVFTTNSCCRIKYHFHPQKCPKMSSGRGGLLPLPFLFLFFIFYFFLGWKTYPRSSLALRPDRSFPLGQGWVTRPSLRQSLRLKTFWANWDFSPRHFLNHIFIVSFVRESHCCLYPDFGSCNLELINSYCLLI